MKMKLRRRGFLEPKERRKMFNPNIPLDNWHYEVLAEDESTCPETCIEFGCVPYKELK